MSLSDKISLRMTELEVERRANLRRAAEHYAATLESTLGDQGSRGQRNPPPGIPHKQTGRLQGSVTVQVDEAAGVATIRCAAPYAKYLSVDRPFYREALERCRSRLRDLLFGKK